MLQDMRFPSVSPEAAQWLVDNRATISCVGIDTTSIEWEPGKFCLCSLSTLLVSEGEINTVKSPHDTVRVLGLTS